MLLLSHFRYAATPRFADYFTLRRQLCEQQNMRYGRQSLRHVMMAIRLPPSSRRH